MKPGIYKMSFDDYKKIDAINNSMLVAASKTLSHCLIEKDITPQMQLGTDAHSYFLELELFKKNYRVTPYNLKLTTKAGKKWLEDNGNKNILKFNQAETLINMAKSLYSGQYETARNLIEQSEREITVVWKHKTEDVLCKARIDLDCQKLGIIADLKTTTDADPETWLKRSLNMGPAHFQPAWYLEGINTISSVKYDTFLWVLLETKPPYGIGVVKATPAPFGKTDMILVAQEQIKQILPKLISAKKRNNFTGYPDKVIDGELPSYYLRGLDI